VLGLWRSENIGMHTHTYVQCLASPYVYVEYTWSTRRISMCMCVGVVGGGSEDIDMRTHTYVQCLARPYYI